MCVTIIVFLSSLYISLCRSPSVSLPPPPSLSPPTAQGTLLSTRDVKNTDYARSRPKGNKRHNSGQTHARARALSLCRPPPPSLSVKVRKRQCVCVCTRARVCTHTDALSVSLSLLVDPAAASAARECVSSVCERREVGGLDVSLSLSLSLFLSLSLSLSLFVPHLLPLSL